MSQNLTKFNLKNRMFTNKNPPEIVSEGYRQTKDLQQRACIFHINYRPQTRIFFPTGSDFARLRTVHPYRYRIPSFISAQIFRPIAIIDERTTAELAY